MPIPSDCRTRFRLWRSTAAVLLILSASVLPAAGSSETDIRAVLAEQVASWNKGDIETFMTSYHNSDATSFVGDVILKGYDTVIERYRRVYGGDAQMGTLAFSDLDIRVLSETNALVIGRFHLRRDESVGGDLKGIYSLVWALIDGEWKIIHDHTSGAAN